MIFFGKRKKKNKSNKKEGNYVSKGLSKTDKKSETSRIKILGSGCSKCNQLEDATKKALEELGMETAIDHVSDFAEIAAYGVMSTPALVIDRKVVSYGKVLKSDEIIKLLKKAKS
ncbi:MAG TPA: thioredoxin family protein [Candidatus Eisenbacteria bacterium]|nr:thioredoxin family protein [Candidatus Eisenbacteria bacterium]